MADYKTLLSILGSAVGIIGFIPYYRDIFRGTTKPHVFTWFVWGLLNVIGFFAQVAAGAGVGAWVTAVVALACLGIAALALKRGEKNITWLDWAMFGGAILGIVLWQITENPLSAVIIVSVTDILAFVPTYRKAYGKPHEETMSQFVFAVFRGIFEILALESLNLTTWLYPAIVVIEDLLFVVLLAVRRRKI